MSASSLQTDGAGGGDDDSRGGDGAEAKKATLRSREHSGRRANHHRTHSLSSSSPSSSSSSLALLPSSSSSSAVIHRLKRHVDALTAATRSTLTSLRSASPSPSLLPHLQQELDAFQSFFASSTAAFAPTLLSLCDEFGQRVEGCEQQCRAASFAVSQSLSALSSSSSSSSSQQIHRIHAQWAQLRDEQRNTELSRAALQAVQQTLLALHSVDSRLSSGQYLQAVDGWQSAAQTLDGVAASASDVSGSHVFRRLQDEADNKRAGIIAAMTAALHRSVQYHHLTVQGAVCADPQLSSSSVVILAVVPAEFGAAASVVAASRRLSSPSVAALCLSPLLSCLRAVLAYVPKVGVEHRWSVFTAASVSASTLLRSHIPALPAALEGTTGAAVAVVRPSGTDEEQGVDIFQLLPRLHRLYSEALAPLMGGRDSQLLAAFSSSLWTDLLPALESELLMSTIPCCVSDLLLYGRLRQRVSEMEQTMRPVSQLPAASSSSPLSSWCDGIQSHFSRNVRLLLLERCRELLIDNDYAAYSAAEPSSALASKLQSYPPLFFPFSLAPYHAASASASFSFSSLTPTPEPAPVPPLQLLGIQLHRRASASFLSSHAPISLHVELYCLTLWELLLQSLHSLAVDAAGGLCEQLLSSLHDAVLLVLSVPEAYSGSQLRSVPMLSWLFATDCECVAHHLQQMQHWLVLQCRLAHAAGGFFSSLGCSPPPAAIVASASLRLVSLVAPLLSLASRWRSHTLVSLRDDTATSLASLPSFHSVQSPAQVASSRSVLSQCLHSLLLSLRGLSSVMRREQRQLVARALICSVCDAVVDRVEAVQDISVEGGKAMEQLLAVLNTKDVREALGLADDAAAAAAGGGLDGWRRLEAVQQLIGSEQTLAKLELQHDAGQFAALRREELIGLLQALYEDSAKRRRMIDRIK